MSKVITSCARRRRASCAGIALALLSMTWMATALAETQPLPPGKPLVQSYGMQDYGGHITNWAIRSGPDGLLYVGGGDGLLIFDGAVWRSVRSRHGDRVRGMAIDAEGRIWAGSPNEFGWFERAPDGAFAYQSLSDGLPEEHRNFSEILTVLRTEDSVYFHAQKHIFRWRDGRLDVLEPWEGVFRTALVHQGQPWVLVGDRFHSIEPFPSPGEAPEPVPGWALASEGRISMLASWPDGRILMGTVSHGLYWLDASGAHPFVTEADLSGVWIFTALPLEDGGLLLGTQNRGLYRFDADGRLRDHVTRRSGLASDRVMAMALDGQGGVWLAQEGAIARVDLFNGLRYYDADSGVARANAVIEHRGRLLVGGLHGVAVLEGDGSDASRLRSLNAPLLDVFGLLDDGDGVLVSGSEGVHRMVFDLEAGRTVSSERVLTDKHGYGLIRSRLRQAIFAELETGLGVLLRTESGWRALNQIEGVVRRAHTVAEEAEDLVWVGTTSGQYYRLAWDGDELVLRDVLDGDDGVPGGYAWAFQLGERTVLATSDGGYRARSLNASAIEPDPQFDNARFGESRGVYKLHLQGDREVIGGIGDGGPLWRGRLEADGRFDWHGRWLPQLQPAANWFFSGLRGHLWIGRHPGLLRVEWPPPETTPRQAPLLVHRVGYPDREEWIRSGPGADVLDAALPSRPDTLRFEYAIASYAHPQANEYRTMLAGLDAQWSSWTRESRRDYTGLAGGNYRFMVQARDVFGTVAEAPPLSFRVRPPAWLAWPALLAYGLALIFSMALAAALGRRWQRGRQLSQQRELEAQVAERTEEVRRQARRIRELSDARVEFFANVSHELRTPLALLRAPLQELAREAGPALNAGHRTYLDMALRNSEVMQSLIGQVLDLQRLDSGRMPLRLVRVDLAESIQAMVDRFRMSAGKAGIELKTEGCAASLSAVCDPVHLDTMVGNLLSNAIKFTPRGGWIRVGLTAGPEGYSISVQDSGPGIAPEQREVIFERYRQGDQRHAGQPGTGIGLALVRELATLHGGSVAVEDADQKGACFVLRLPADLQPSAQADGSESAATDGARNDESAGELPLDDSASDDQPCVLIVEDNAELREFLRLRLGRSYRIVEADDGEAGLRLAREHLPDAVVTDGLMPRMDGLTMTRAIKADPELDFVPVLMLTSRADPKDVVRGIEAGADDYLSKPFDSAELAARVAGLIASRRRLRARLVEQLEPSEPPEASAATPFQRRLEAVLSEHLADPGFSVRDWSDLMHMDRTTLFRRLKAELGRSPEEHLREVRLQAAARLLEQRRGNVAEVADAVGFASVSYFSRRFRERFDCTPAAWARRDNPPD